MAETAEETDNAWWTKPTFIISAIAVVLLIGTGIILFTFLGNNEETDAAPPAQPQTSAPTATAAESVTGGSICGLNATGGTTMTTAPENVEWEFLGGIAAPKSAEHGPGLVDEQTGVRSCYSHTPEGALLAVTGMLAASGDTELLMETTRALVLEGPGKQRTIDSLEDRLKSGNTSSVPIEVAGFRLLSYSPERATVEVVLAADSSEGKIYQTTASDVVWSDGDWHFNLDTDGSGGPIDGQITDLSGYVPWGPVSG
ncbi:hypothetical protein P4U43_06490 [Arthrobacter sp. EH-1B-1]|uniref:DUF8175 domain-containing protein n=1 Tax=Arthrobacter vasquezii TaxID=2977629 RepID=A0ABT6CV50_9MICC|nr:hypothetical protein [Arthrobacter vasquezii]MDF9277440.1 hypothetical protein [Arthrobacter vasquezii]